MSPRKRTDRQQFIVSLEGVRRGRPMEHLELAIDRLPGVETHHLQLPVRGPGHFVVYVQDGYDADVMKQTVERLVQQAAAS